MVDWHRMTWQYRANCYAELSRCLCIVVGADEAAWALQYHFPWWDDVSLALTIAVYTVARFVDKHTRIYRWDLD